MDSDDRSFSIVAGFVCAMIVALVFMVSSCVLQEDRIKAPQRTLETRSEHILKMRCIEMRGEWTHEDYADKCKFK